MSGYGHFRAMELLKFTNMAPDFYPSSRRINGSILEYVPIGATKKMGKKTSHVVNFIVSMALTFSFLLQFKQTLFSLVVKV